MIEVTRVVHTSTPRERVADYLSDFTTSADWDPHTAACDRVDSGATIDVGSEFDNVQRIGPLRSTFRYRVEQYERGHRVVLASSSSSLDATDEMTFASDGPGTTVTYTARLQLKGIAKAGEPLLRRLMSKLADDGAAGMQGRLDSLGTTVP